MVIALPIITSCSAVTDHPDPCPAENDITLSFTMHTTARMSDGSRADGAGHEEVDSEYEEFEDAVNVNDFIFFIFVGEGDDATLLVKNKDIASSTDPTTMITGAPVHTPSPQRLRSNIWKRYWGIRHVLRVTMK